MLTIYLHLILTCQRIFHSNHQRLNSIHRYIILQLKMMEAFVRIISIKNILFIDFVLGLDLLGEKWTPNLSLVTSRIISYLKIYLYHFFHLVLLQIIELLADPSTESPVVPAIAQQILKNPQEFYETARTYTNKYAQPKESQ